MDPADNQSCMHPALEVEEIAARDDLGRNRWIKRFIN